VRHGERDLDVVVHEHHAVAVEQHERAVDARVGRERAVALDLGDRDAPREAVGAAGRPRRDSAACPPPFFHGTRRNSRGAIRRWAVIAAGARRRRRAGGGHCMPFDGAGAGHVDSPGGGCDTECFPLVVEYAMRPALPALATSLAAALVLALPASAQDIPVAIGLSGWTGFAPLTLAKEAGIFKKNGLDVSLKKIPQKDRHLAIASGDVQCAATTVETWIVWNANGVPTTQIFQLDKSYGADGMAVRADVQKISDLKGKTVAASSPGTAPYFTLAWFLKKNGLSVKDVTVVNLEPGPPRRLSSPDRTTRR
jgi:hypothetical protein